jgi:maleate isomerase
MQDAGPRTLPAVEYDQAVVPRIGLIALSTDLTSESDAARVLPGAGVALHTTRVAFENPTTPESLMRMQPLLRDAARLLVPEMPLAAIWYSCTAASAIIGDAAVAGAIGAGRPGVPVLTPPQAALSAFAALGVRRIAVLTPYLARTTGEFIGYFEATHIAAVSTLSLGIEDDRDMARVSRASILAAAAAADHPEAEALFISCTALPAMAAVAEIEAMLGKPVVTSNQAALWRLGALTGRRLTGPGRLFAMSPHPEPA